MKNSTLIHDVTPEQITSLFEGLQNQLTELKQNFQPKVPAEYLTVTIYTAEEAASIVKRLGLIIYRIAMLFTALRKFENQNAANNMVCTDNDFNTALQLAGIYLQHSILMFNSLPKKAITKNFKGDNKHKLFDALPDEFTRQEAVTLGTGELFKLSTHTIDNFLKSLLVTQQLTQPKTGHYQKIMHS